MLNVFAESLLPQLNKEKGIATIICKQSLIQVTLPMTHNRHNPFYLSLFFYKVRISHTHTGQGRRPMTEVVPHVNGVVVVTATAGVHQKPTRE